MAKLRKVIIKGYEPKANKHYQYDTQLEYSAGSKVFFIRLPKDQQEFKPEDEETAKLVSHVQIRGVMGIVPSFTGETEKEVVKKAEAFYKEYLQAERTERKVILYHFEYKSKNVIKDADKILEARDSIESKDDTWWSGPEENELQTLRFGYVVCEEHVFGSEKSYVTRHTSSLGGEEHDLTRNINILVYQHDWKIMDWTEGREQFFENLKAGMHEMIQQVDGFVSDNEVLTTLIDTGTQMLLPKKVERTE